MGRLSSNTTSQKNTEGPKPHPVSLLSVTNSSSYKGQTSAHTQDFGGGGGGGGTTEFSNGRTVINIIPHLEF